MGEAINLWILAYITIMGIGIPVVLIVFAIKMFIFGPDKK